MTDDPFDDLAPVPPEAAPEPDPGADPAAAEFAAATLAESAALPLNDTGNGKRFVLHEGEDVLFVPRVGWHVWDGTRWAKDEDQIAVRRRVERLSDIIAAEVPHVPMDAATTAAARERGRVEAEIARLSAVDGRPRSAEDAEALARLQDRARDIRALLARHDKKKSQRRAFAVTSGNFERMKKALEVAAVHLARRLDEMDSAPLAVNVANGTLKFRVVDAREDGGGRVASVTLAPHDRADLITKVAGAAYDPEARCPEFDAFLARIQPDAEMRSFLQRWMGYSLTAEPVQRLAFFHGDGANGKSLLVDVIARIAGGYGATARIESLTGQNRRGGGDATPDLIPLMGARMVRAKEPEEGTRLQEALIKELTGGEPLLVRALHADFVEVQPVFKLTISGNHKPDIRGTDDGIWRRLWLVPFEVQIPEGERDEQLGARIVAREASGVLNWMIEGLIDALEGGLQPPERVRQATEGYREEQDPVGVFLKTCCTVTGDAADTIRAAELVHAFNYHLLERGLSTWQPRTVTLRLARAAGVWRHPDTGRSFVKTKASVSQYGGLRLTDAFRRRFDVAPKDHQGRPLGMAADVTGGSPQPLSGASGEDGEDG